MGNLAVSNGMYYVLKMIYSSKFSTSTNYLQYNCRESKIQFSDKSYL